MNSRIARKRLHISKHNVPSPILAHYDHLNIKAARYLRIHNKIIWLHTFKPKLLEIQLSWEKVSEIDLDSSFCTPIKEKLVDAGN